MADQIIPVDFIDFSSENDVIPAQSIDFTILGDDVTNTSIVPTDSSAGFIIFGSVVTNTSTVYNTSSIDFIILPNVVSNTSTIYQQVSIDILSRSFDMSIVTNTSTVFNPTIIFPINVDTVYNTATVFNSNNIILEQFVYAETTSNVNKVYPCVIGFSDIPVVGVLNDRKTSNVVMKQDFIFSDFALDFLPHPITGDIARLYDAQAINQSLHNILLTKKFERPFDNYNVSSQIRSLLFELSDNMMATELKSEIFQTLVNFEQRINILDIIVEATPQKHEIYIKLFYKIKTFEKVEMFQTIITRT